MNRDAFNRRVVLRMDREHSWRHHGRNGTLLKEVLGILDKWAAREEKKSGYRFVFAHRDTILNLCFKGKREEGKHFSLTQLKRIFDELRAEHIMSRYFETGDGRFGFIVAPHDSLCRVQDNVCILPNRSIALPAPEMPVIKGRLAALAALKAAPIRPSTRHRDDTQHGPDTALNTAPASRIEDTEHGPQHGSGESLYLSNFAMLTESEKADWLASREQFGASIPCIRLSDVSLKPYNPSIPCIQDELKHHREFLERVKSKSKVKSADLGSFSLEPKTEEPKTEKSTTTPMKSQRRKPILPQDEYQKVKADKELTETFGGEKPVFTADEIKKMTVMGINRVPCQVDRDIIWWTDKERMERGYTVLSACTIHGGYNLNFGEACWHKT
jgi:hypothetical protein